MVDEMRVTVVATGLGDDKPMVEPVPEPVDLQPVRVANSDVVLEQPDYGDFDTPPQVRRNAESARDYVDAAKDSMEYLDIPAFLRRQAD
jgi:cell division protein FtsZ